MVENVQDRKEKQAMTKNEAMQIAELLDKACPGKESRDFDKWVDLVSAMRKVCSTAFAYTGIAYWDGVAYGYQKRDREKNANPKGITYEGG